MANPKWLIAIGFNLHSLHFILTTNHLKLND
jgi:hypothetical protein